MSYGKIMGQAVFGFGVVALLASTPSLAADESTQATVTKISDFAQLALNYAGVLTAAGTVSMALVELIKGLFDLRRRFQQSKLNQWLKGEAPDVRSELLYLSIGDKKHDNILCGQPLDKMMGQIQAAARIALDYPNEFPALFAFLCKTDFEKAAPSTHVAFKDRAIWTTHAKTHRSIVAPAPTSPAQTAAASDAAQARSRLANLVSRKLDGFQLRTQFWWDRSNQTFSIGVSCGLLGTALYEQGMGLAASLGLGLLGGLIAPFAKDFSQSLSKFASK